MSLYLHYLCVAALVVSASLSGRAAAPASAPWNAPAPAVEGATLVTRDPMESSRWLGPIYKREAEGFRLCPPVGSRIIETAGMDLMSFVVDQKAWGGSVQRITVREVMSLEDFVKTTKTQLTTGNSFKGVQVLEEKYLRKDNFPSARLAFSMDAELGPAIPAGILESMRKSSGQTGDAPAAVNTRVSLLRQEIVSRVKDNQFFVLTMYSPLKDRETAMKTFEQMLAEYDLFDPVAIRQRRTNAIGAGKEWLAKQSAEQFVAKMSGAPVYYRMLVGAKDVGYIRFDEMTQETNPKGSGRIAVERDGKKGALLTVNFRSFPDDGSVVYGQNEAFWAFSKSPRGEKLPDYSSWSNVSKTKASLAKSSGAVRSVSIVTPWIQETGLLTQLGAPFEITVALTGDATQRLPEGIRKVVPLEAAAPLPKILEYSWTRFVDLNKPSEMSFVVYDSVKKKLANRNLIVTGQKEMVTIDGRSVTCYKCIDELDPNSTTLWTDKDGRIQMMCTSDQSVMIPTTEAASNAKWAGRLKDQ
jgi:hypothetical protein